jgi:hypothetical protein
MRKKGLSFLNDRSVNNNYEEAIGRLSFLKHFIAFVVVNVKDPPESQKDKEKAHP